MEDEDWVEMPNGCLCCTAKDRAVEAIEALVASRPIDHVLVEASGLSDPGPVAGMFWKDDAMGSGLRLNGVVALVDLSRVRDYLRGRHAVAEAERQILLADVVLLNKTDLVEKDEVEEWVAEVSAINPTALVKCTAFAKLCDLRELLSMNRLAKSFGLSSERNTPGVYTSEDESLHKHSITHIFYTFPYPLPNKNALDVFANALLWSRHRDEQPKCQALDSESDELPEVIRAKGLFFVESSENESKEYIFEAVGELYEFRASFNPSQKYNLNDELNKDLKSSVLVLGRHLSNDFVKSCFDRCLRPMS